MTSQENSPTLVWLRHDLRLTDQPALAAALRRGGPVIPLFIWAPEEEGEWAPGAAGRGWLRQSLGRLDEALQGHGSRLILRAGESLATLCALTRETGAGAVFWNRLYEPAMRARDERILDELAREGLTVEVFEGSLLVDPEALRTGKGDPYRVFTPFWKACARRLAQSPPAVEPPPPARFSAPERWPDSVSLDQLGLVDSRGTALSKGFWQPGEAGARASLERFLNEAIAKYPAAHDRPDYEGTSRLSPHLHFGEISPGQIWREAWAHEAHSGQSGALSGTEAFLRQLAWREFAYHLLIHFPHTPTQPLRAKFKDFEWKTDPEALERWQRGLTGYPLVDAGMRQMRETGWMHNRVRMVVASLLVKNMLIPWQAGARWFWEALADADLANNTLGWQWVAGCGADAAPFFRVFNPISQGEKFDPAGAYVRQWVPELQALPREWIHRPWQAPAGVLDKAGVALGRNYPRPVVDLATSRIAALQAYDQLKKGGGG